MDLVTYQQRVGEIGFGKRLPTALYVYRDPGFDFGPELNQLLAMKKTVRA